MAHCDKVGRKSSDSQNKSKTPRIRSTLTIDDFYSIRRKTAFKEPISSIAAAAVPDSDTVSTADTSCKGGAVEQASQHDEEASVVSAFSAISSLSAMTSLTVRENVNRILDALVHRNRTINAPPPDYEDRKKSKARETAKPMHQGPKKHNAQERNCDQQSPQLGTSSSEKKSPPVLRKDASILYSGTQQHVTAAEKEASARQVRFNESFMFDEFSYSYYADADSASVLSSDDPFEALEDDDEKPATLGTKILDLLYVSSGDDSTQAAESLLAGCGACFPLAERVQHCHSTPSTPSCDTDTDESSMAS